jgi:hypothetical protein
MWLQANGAPSTRYHGLAQPHLLGHAAGRPVSGVRGLSFQSHGDEVLDLIIADPVWRPGARCIS